MSLERINLYPVQEQLNILRDMRRYHQEMQDADIVASLNVQFADRLAVVESESVQPVQTVRKLSRKQRRAARRVQNARHHHSDRLHGKKQMPSAKFIREADKQDMYHAHAKFVWHKNHKGEWIPRTVRKHDKFWEKRLNESAQSQFNHTPFDEDVWDFVAELPDPLEEEKAGDYWKSSSNFLRTDSVWIEDAEMCFSKGHYILVETGTVYYEDGDGQHGEYWERETIIY